MNIAPSHPIHQLLFFIGDDFEDDVPAKVEDLLARLATVRNWVLGPPEFVDEVTEAESPGDEPIRTMGGILELYSGWPPWGDRLPPEVDRAQLEDVEALIYALSEFSSQTRLPIEFELEGDSIGSIDRGEMDRSLAEGLLGEWRKSLRA